MKKLTLLAISALLINSQPAFSETNNQYLAMDNYRLAIGSSNLDMFRSAGWNLPSCPTAKVARIVGLIGNDTVANEAAHGIAVSTAMMAYANNKSFILHATCNTNNSNLINVTHIFLEQN